MVVERTIRIIKERTIDKEDHKFLDKGCRIIRKFIRYCALCQMMAMFPNELLKPQTMSEYMERMFLAKRIIIEKVLKNSAETNDKRAKRKISNMTKLPEVKFLPGTFVTATYNDGKLPSKLVLPRRDPFRVIEHSINKVHVQNLVTMKDEWLLPSTCNQFLYDPNRVDPVDIARKACPDPVHEVIDKQKPFRRNMHLERIYVLKSNGLGYILLQNYHGKIHGNHGRILEMLSQYIDIWLIIIWVS
jgi:hypothetical protein